MAGEVVVTGLKWFDQTLSVTQIEHSRVSESASILASVNTTESKFTIRGIIAGGGGEVGTDDYFGDRSLVIKVLGDSADLCVGFAGQSAFCQVFRANAGR